MPPAERDALIEKGLQQTIAHARQQVKWSPILPEAEREELPPEGKEALDKFYAQFDESPTKAVNSVKRMFSNFGVDLPFAVQQVMKNVDAGIEPTKADLEILLLTVGKLMNDLS